MMQPNNVPHNSAKMHWIYSFISNNRNVSMTNLPQELWASQWHGRTSDSWRIHRRRHSHSTWMWADHWLSAGHLGNARFMIKIASLIDLIRHRQNFWAFTKDRFWPDFANIKHDYTQEFYRSYSSFISQCPRTGKFRSVWFNAYIFISICMSSRVQCCSQFK